MSVHLIVMMNPRVMVMMVLPSSSSSSLQVVREGGGAGKAGDGRVTGEAMAAERVLNIEVRNGVRESLGGDDFLT